VRCERGGKGQWVRLERHSREALHPCQGPKPNKSPKGPNGFGCKCRCVGPSFCSACVIHFFTSGFTPTLESVMLHKCPWVVAFPGRGVLILRIFAGIWCSVIHFCSPNRAPAEVMVTCQFPFLGCQHSDGVFLCDGLLRLPYQFADSQ